MIKVTEVRTLLGLLIAKDYGVNFDTKDAGAACLKYLLYACTAEEIALKNLKENVTALEATDMDNPYVQWIGFLLERVLAFCELAKWRNYNFVIISIVVNYPRYEIEN